MFPTIFGAPLKLPVELGLCKTLCPAFPVILFGRIRYDLYEPDWEERLSRYLQVAAASAVGDCLDMTSCGPHTMGQLWKE